MPDLVCTVNDGFLGDQTGWWVELNDGQRAYMDDGRPGLQERSAWLRLIEYCKQTGLYPINFVIQFRDHAESLPAHAEGYFFSLGALGGTQMTETFSLFVTGYKVGNIVKVRKWKVPEIIVISDEDRLFEDCKHLMICRPTP